MIASIQATCFLFHIQGKKALLLIVLLMNQKSELCSDLPIWTSYFDKVDAYVDWHRPEFTAYP